MRFAAGLPVVCAAHPAWAFGSREFYSDRNAGVSMDDKFVSFSTKLGRMEIRVKFTMKEMLYHGKLAV